MNTGTIVPVDIHVDAGRYELAQLLGGFLLPPSWQRRCRLAACDATCDNALLPPRQSTQDAGRREASSPSLRGRLPELR